MLLLFSKQKKSFLKKNGGFTLIELMMVITIIIILIAVIAINFSDMRKKNRDTRAKADLRQMINAFELQYNDLGYYPDGSDPVIPNSPPGSSIPAGNTLLAPYLNPVPNSNGVRSYFWYDDGVGQKFCLYFQLELDPSKYFTCSNHGCQISGSTTCPGF